MLLDHLEPIVRAVDAHLKARLPAKIAEVNAHWKAAGYEEPVLTVPADDAYYPGGFTVLKYPCVEFAAPDFDLTSLPLEHIDADGGTQIAMRAWVEDLKTEPGRLYYRALRMGQAILATMMERPRPDLSPAIAPFGTNAQLSRDRPARGAYRFNPETETRDEVAAAIVVVFSLETIETVAS